MARPTLYLIDGNNQMYRAYHAIRGLSGPDGRSTNAVLMVQPQVAQICSMASCVPKTTRCLTPTRRRRRYDVTTYA